MVPNVIQVAVLKYAMTQGEQTMVCDPPIMGIVVLPATDATILLFADNLEMVFVNEIVDAKTGGLSVQRGSNGTWAYAHEPGTKILAGPPPSFVEFDPSGSCDAQPENQIVNSLNGNLWACESGTWTQQSY
jgi:hypothetical protein